MESNKDRRDTSQRRSYRILNDDKEKEAAEISNSFEATSWYFTILGEVNYTILMSCNLWVLYIEIID